MYSQFMMHGQKNINTSVVIKASHCKSIIMSFITES